MFSTFLDNHTALVRRLFTGAIVLILAYAAIHIFRVALLPTDENIFADRAQGLVIIEIYPGGASDLAGLKVGDVITRINGKAFKNALEADFILRSGQVGKEYHYTVLRGGEEMTLPVKLAQAGLPIVYVVRVFSGLLTLLLGYLVVMLRPAFRQARLFAACFILLGHFLLLSGAQVRGDIYNDFLTWIWPYILVPSLPLSFAMAGHVSLNFPAKMTLKELPRWLVPSFYLLIVLHSIYIIFLVKRPDITYTISTTIIALYALILPPIFYRKHLNPEWVKKMRYIRIGGYIALACLVLIILMESRKGGYVYAPYLMFGFNLWPLANFYTIFRFRIFDIYLVIRRTFIYTALTWLVVATAVTGILYSINTLPGWSIDFPVIRLTTRSIELVRLERLPDFERSHLEKSILISFGILITVLIWQAQKWGKVLLERTFYQQKTDYRQALQDFSRLSTRYTDRDVLAKEVVKRISDTMHLKGAALAFATNGAFHIRESVGLNQDCCRDISFNPNESWVRSLVDMRSSGAVDNLGVRHLFHGTGIQFMTPVVAHDKLEGIILLGEKHSQANYTKDDVELLDSLSRHVAAAIETMRLYEEVSEKERLKGELEIARRIQLDSLPAETPQIPGLDIAAFSRPALEVGGDFYDFLVRHDSVTFMLGDVSGKGTSAALYMSRVQGIIRSLDSYQPSLWELFVRLNSQVYGHIERKSYVTVIGVRVNLLDYSTSFIRAGHLPLIHFHASTRSIEIYQPQGLGVGLDERQFASSLVEQRIQPKLGDVVLLFSDGVSEAVNSHGEEFSIRQIESVLLQSADLSAEEIKETLLSSLTRHTSGMDQHDDFTVVIIKFV